MIAVIVVYHHRYHHHNNHLHHLYHNNHHHHYHHRYHHYHPTVSKQRSNDIPVDSLDLGIYIFQVGFHCGDAMDDADAMYLSIIISF